METPLQKDSFALSTLCTVIQAKRAEISRLQVLMKPLTTTPPAAERDHLQSCLDTLQREVEALERIRQATFLACVYYEPVRIEYFGTCLGFRDRETDRSFGLFLTVPIAQHMIKQLNRYLDAQRFAAGLERAG